MTNKIKSKEIQDL